MPSSWLTPIDNYCERLGPGFWAEPLNALSNGAFLLAAASAFWLWRKQEARDWPGLWLIAVATTVGIGSFLFHTLANRWSLLADVLPIAAFIYSYFLLALRRYLRLGLMAALIAALVFAAFNMSFTRLWFGLFPGVSLNGSVGYIPAALALLVVGALSRTAGSGRAGASLLQAAGLFALSLLFRSIDESACAELSTGTHFLWHMLNGLVLGMLMRAAIVHGRSFHASD